MQITKEAIIKWCKEERDRLELVEKERADKAEQARIDAKDAKDKYEEARNSRASLEEIIGLLEDQKK